MKRLNYRVPFSQSRDLEGCFDFKAWVHTLKNNFYKSHLGSFLQGQWMGELKHFNKIFQFIKF